MNVIERLQRLTRARIEAFLTTVEDPELLYPQLLREMEDKVREATQVEAKAAAALKLLQKEVAELREKIQRMQRGAELAMSKNDEATARDALSAQINLEGDVGRKESAIPRLEQALENARDARKDIQTKLDEMRAKKDEILTRARTARNQKAIEKSVHGRSSSASSILDTVSQMEGKIEETETELEIQREVSRQSGGPGLEKRLKDLETGASIDDRLAALKLKAGSKS